MFVQFHAELAAGDEQGVSDVARVDDGVIGVMPETITGKYSDAETFEVPCAAGDDFSRSEFVRAADSVIDRDAGGLLEFIDEAGQALALRIPSSATSRGPSISLPGASIPAAAQLAPEAAALASKRRILTPRCARRQAQLSPMMPAPMIFMAASSAQAATRAAVVGGKAMTCAGL